MPDSQTERWGLLCRVPMFTTVYDIDVILTQFFKDPSVIRSVSPVSFKTDQFKWEWAMLIEADPHVISDLDAKLSDELIFDRSLPTFSLRDSDWPRVHMRASNQRAEFLARSRHIQLLKSKCPLDLDGELADLIQNENFTFVEVFDRFVGVMRERNAGDFEWLSVRRPTSPPSTPVYLGRP